MIQFGVVTPILYLAICALVAGLLTWLLYRRHSFEHKIAARVMALLRFSGIFLLLLLLLSPFLKLRVHEEIPPKLLIFTDRSLSADSSGTNSAKQRLDEILPELSKEFAVVEYEFGSLVGFKGDSVGRNKTNISAVLDRVNEESESNPNLTALLISDGIYNSGVNPLFKKLQRNPRLYTLAVGDTTSYPDADLSGVEANATVFLGNELQISCQIKARLLKGRSASLELFESGKVVRSVPLRFDSDESFVTHDFFVKPAGSGSKIYTIRISGIVGENNTANNSRTVSVNVTDTRRKIVLSWHAMHPDISALYNTLRDFGQYEIIRTPFHSLRVLNDADLYILHGFGANRQEQQFMEELAEKKIPFWAIAGIHTKIQFLGISANPLRGNLQSGIHTDVQPLVNRDFQSFDVSNFSNELSNWPPLKSPSGNVETVGSWKTLLFKNIGMVETNYPLFGFFENAGSRNAFLFGEGIWRWKMNEKALKSTSEAFNDFVMKSVQYLTAVKHRSGLRCYTNTGEFGPSDNSVVFGEFTDESGNLNTNGKCTVTLNSGKEVKTMTMQKINQVFRADFGRLPAGNYSYTVQHVTNGGKTVCSGVFNVNAEEAELRDLTADFGLLRALARSNNGKIFTASGVSELRAELLNGRPAKTIIRERIEITEFIRLKWLFVLIVVVFAAEWFLRKWFGSY